MYSIAHFAAAIILTSALGAFVLCLLVIRYGFTPPDDEPLPVRHRRFFVTRLGHALGAVCFAITAGLAGVALSVGSRAPAPVAPVVSERVDVAPLHAAQARLANDLRALDERIERAEATVAQLRAASTAEPARRVVVERTPRPARPATPPAPREAAEIRQPGGTPPAEKETVAAIPRRALETSAPAAPSASAPGEPVAPTEARGPGDRLRVARNEVKRLGNEIGERAVTAGRAVRDFFRELERDAATRVDRAWRLRDNSNTGG